MTHATLTIDGKSMPVSNFTTTLPGLSYVKVSTAFLSHIAMEGRFNSPPRMRKRFLRKAREGDLGRRRPSKGWRKHVRRMKASSPATSREIEMLAEIDRLRSSLSEMRGRAAKVVEDEAARQDATARKYHFGTMAAAAEIVARTMEKAAANIRALPDEEDKP